MAELHVQRKRSGYIWLWLLLIIIGVSVGIYLYLHYKNPKEFPVSMKSTGWVKQGNISIAKRIQV